MEDAMAMSPNNQIWQDIWGLSLRRAICTACAREFLLASENTERECPNCFRSRLEFTEDALPADAPPVIPAFSSPEQYLPFQVTISDLQAGWQRFLHHIWFPPHDLKPENLNQRLQVCYLPIWLVDSQVQANWQAEAGFNYQVLSHKDQYDDFRGSWRSQEVTETRQRWETRLGHLQRTYSNISTPALEDHPVLVQRLGAYDLSRIQPYTKDGLLQISVRIPWVIRLPDRGTQDAWKDALPGFIQAASEECRRACGADHIRSFRWSPNFNAQNWTCLLIPALFTYYFDDDRNIHMLSVNGQNGHMYGVRRASMRRARSMVLWIVLVGMFIFIASLAGFAFSVLLPVLSLLAALGLLLTLLLGVFTVIPLLVVWGTNRKPSIYQD